MRVRNPLMMYLALATFVAGSILLLAKFPRTHVESPDYYPTATGWIRSADIPPPHGQPFMAFWINDNHIECYATIQIGCQFHFYDLDHVPCVGGLITENVPPFWDGMPGEALSPLPPQGPVANAAQ